MGNVFLILLAAYSSFDSFVSTQNCLGDGEKESFTAIERHMEQLKSQISSLKTSLQEKIANPSCQKGWIPYRDHCHFFSSNSLNWYESERFCREHGSNLAKIEDGEENAWILTKAPKDDYALWVGASDMKEGQWLWNVDFTSLSYENWYRGNEPNGGTSENCLNFLGEKYNGTWNDSSCDSKRQFLCKRKMKCDCGETKKNE